MHERLTKSRKDLESIGDYRKHKEVMQIVSSNVYDQKIYYEAPSSSEMSQEMENFINWFNESKSLPPLTRAGIAHLYFVAIHPFEDGNGRIGRALCEKVFAQYSEFPVFSSLSYILQKNKKEYYLALEKSNHSLEITQWLVYFSKTVLRGCSTN